MKEQKDCLSNYLPKYSNMIDFKLECIVQIPRKENIWAQLAELYKSRRLMGRRKGLCALTVEKTNDMQQKGVHTISSIEYGGEDIFKITGMKMDD